MQSIEKKPARGWFRRTLLQLEIGAFLGLLAWGLAGGAVITWRYRPAADQTLSCAPSVQAALTDFVEFQLLAVAGGAALVVLVGSLGRKKPERAKPSAGA